MWSGPDKPEILWFLDLHFGYNSCFFFKWWMMHEWVGEWMQECQALPTGTCILRGGGRHIAVGGPGPLMDVCAMSHVGTECHHFCLGGHVGHYCLHRRGNPWVNIFNKKNGHREINQQRSSHWVTDKLCVRVCVCIHIHTQGLAEVTPAWVWLVG